MTNNTRRGRTAGFQMSDEHRQKIANSKILGRLIRHAEGELTEDGKELMTPSQVTTGLGLLKKVLPDLQAVQHSGEEGGPLVLKVTLGGDT